MIHQTVSTTTRPPPQQSGLDSEAVIMEKDFSACYNARDLILYALSCGFGSHAKTQQEVHDELLYLFEEHPDFQAVPTFCLALSWWAQPQKLESESAATSYHIPRFPPPSMDATVMIPPRFLKTNTDISAYPILHMFQSMDWHQNLPVPSTNTSDKMASSRIQNTHLNCKILTIAPKKIGTFVTSETTIHSSCCDDEASSSSPRNKLLCTLQSTCLVLGLSPESVIAQDISSSRKRANPSRKPVPPPAAQAADFEFTYRTSPTQSLLYRLASGDSNRIHVVGDAMLSKKLKATQTPILHGLCTLGIATRAILQYARQTSSTRTTKEAYRLAYLEGKFSNPVFIEDTLVVKLWDVASLSSSSLRSCNNNNNMVQEIVFQVYNLSTGNMAVDQGYAQLVPIPKNDANNYDGSATTTASLSQTSKLQQTSKL